MLKKFLLIVVLSFVNRVSASSSAVVESEFEIAKVSEIKKPSFYLGGTAFCSRHKKKLIGASTLGLLFCWEVFWARKIFLSGQPEAFIFLNVLKFPVSNTLLRTTVKLRQLFSSKGGGNGFGSHNLDNLICLSKIWWTVPVLLVAKMII